MNQLKIKIEKGIPLPVGQLKGITDAFRKMEIGDSFVIPLKSRGGIYSTASRQGIKVRCAYDEKDPTSLRVWRVA